MLPSPKFEVFSSVLFVEETTVNSLCLGSFCCVFTYPTVVAPARKHSRTVKSSQGPAEVVRQPQPQEVSTHIILQALLEPIVNCVSAEVTRQLSSSSGDWKTNDHQLSDQISDEHVTGNAPGADQMSEVPLAGILGESPSQSVIQGPVTQFQEMSGETYEP